MSLSDLKIFMGLSFFAVPGRTREDERVNLGFLPSGENGGIWRFFNASQKFFNASMKFFNVSQKIFNALQKFFSASQKKTEKTTC